MSKIIRSDTLPGLNFAWYTKYYNYRNMCLSILCTELYNFKCQIVFRGNVKFLEKEVDSLYTINPTPTDTLLFFCILIN